ncbi:YicC family protein [Rhizobiales bacterium RZME27]|uniref:YicC family protein n=1 Tax=Endobacterium cereale TaxID=2663029 RepID=A0A6A8ACB5_9HYPH|nr:YicC/YloC family endoribonuclease [Endobacterium cereale]MEB2846173.1 YicC/YloC family endoribonuclease [Endobacterium cereale]MQY48384.1 YicC family protein [Endobacterium cereale]
MSLQSMTGFARSEGTSGRTRWAWELRSVNGKGLDLRLRLPTGLERLEVPVRAAVPARFSRGNIQANLSVTVAEAKVEAVLNRDALDAILRMRAELGDLVDPSPLRLDTLMSIRGLVDIRDAEEGADASDALDREIMAGLDIALNALTAMRVSEGASIGAVLQDHVNTISTLTTTVEADPSRSPDEIARKLAQQVATLMEGASSLDRDRLYAEAAILATKADLREEIDRLHAHVVAATELLNKGGPVGRRLDFLAQEFNRESNTICSKSNSAAVTAAGIELKVVIDQFREQVQNLE